MVLSKDALVKLNEQAPELAKYVTAFRDLSDEMPEDSGIHVGMFILDIEGASVYVPVVSKSDRIQPIETLYCAESKMFIPLTKKYVKWFIDTKPKMGVAKDSKNSVRNPSLKDAITPPKTGKYLYASEGRLHSFIDSLSNELRQEMKSDIEKVAQEINRVMPVEALMECLGRVAPEINLPAPREVEVVTSAKGLSEEEIQEILEKGYIVKNAPKAGRVAVIAGNNQAIEKISAGVAGEARQLVSFGDSLSVAILDGYSPVQSDNVFVAENGARVSGDAIGLATAQPSDAVLDKLTHKPLGSVSKGDYGLIDTGDGVIGPLSVYDVVLSGDWIKIETSKGAVNVHESVHGRGGKTGRGIFLNPLSSTFIVMNREERVNVITDVNTAQAALEAGESKILPVVKSIMERDGTYAVDGKEVGPKIKMLEYALREWALSVPTAETLIKSAEERTKLVFRMSKEAAEIPSYGDKLPPDTETNLPNKVREVAEVKDREIMEATIISEMLRNPDLHGSIKEYLPEIKEAIDKLGRTLFLIRLNSGKLTDDMDSEALNSLITSTRNSLRVLGDNYVELENLSSNG